VVCDIALKQHAVCVCVCVLTVCSKMSNGVVALFGIIKPLSAMRSVESLSRTFNMPYITSAAPSSSSYLSSLWSSTSPLPPSSQTGATRNQTLGVATGGSGSGGTASNAFMLYLRPLYRTAIIDLVRYYGWTKVYYIYDSNEGK